MPGAPNNTNNNPTGAIPVYLVSVSGASAPLGYEQITGLNVAKALTVPEGATSALITPQDKDTRWRDDGVSPTATVGMPLTAGSSMSYSGDLTAIKFIEQSASAKLNVSYYS